MHSPIFYITEKVGTTVDEMKDSLPTEEEFFYLVEETDWFELNTTDDATWHRGQYDNPIEIFENNPLYKVETLDNSNFYKITITAQNLTDYLERYKSLEKKENDIKEKAEKLGIEYFYCLTSTHNNQFTQEEIDASKSFFDISGVYGGVVIVNTDEEHGFIVNVNVLYKVAKMQMILNKTEYTFYLCTAFQGDYHF